MPELMIANVVRQRLTESRQPRTQLCRHCGEEILAVKTRIGGLVFLDMELRKHTCPSRKNTGGNNGRL